MARNASILADRVLFIKGRFASCCALFSWPRFLRFQSDTVRGCFARGGRIPHHAVSKRSELTVDPPEAVHHVKDIRRTALYG